MLAALERGASVVDAATEAMISENTVRAWIRRGRLDPEGRFGAFARALDARRARLLAQPAGSPPDRLEDAGLDDSHVFHDLRHTFGTRTAAAGVPIRTLQEWLGHKHISTTLRYADYAPSGREGEMIAAAFVRPERQGSIQSSILSEPEGTQSTS